MIDSINKDLYESLIKELDENNIFYFCIEQIRFKNYIINTSFGVKQCLLLDSNGVVIDGFSRSPINNYLYKGKTFYELLGGVDGIANPIDKLIYIDNIYLGPIQPHAIDKTVMCGQDYRIN
jgi:hypothetical protein